MSETWLSIKYRDFQDVPRMVVVLGGAKVLLLDCPFSEEIDDYPDFYAVYEMPADTFEIVTYLHDWTNLPARGRRVGAVPVREVCFDTSRRKAVLERSLAPLFSRPVEPENDSTSV